MKIRKIRASMLPSYSDCARRTAAKQFGWMIESAGFELQKPMPSVGAAVGTATHAAAALILRAKMDAREPPTPAEATAAALAAFQEEIAPGAEWDQTTPNAQTAALQIERLVAAYVPVANTLRPHLVESELRAQIGPGWELTGHVDVYEGGERAGPDDLKTGALIRPYQSQLGAYNLLLRSNGYPVERCGITFIKRAPKTKPQPPAIRQEYDVATCERAAYSTIEAIRFDVEAFEKSGDPFAFQANPMSLMCSKRYCPAWGTGFCTLHLETGDSENDRPID